jgi:hypothetical protein
LRFSVMPSMATSYHAGRGSVKRSAQVVLVMF